MVATGTSPKVRNRRGKFKNYNHHCKRGISVLRCAKFERERSRDWRYTLELSTCIGRRKFDGIWMRLCR